MHRRKACVGARRARQLLAFLIEMTTFGTRAAPRPAARAACIVGPLLAPRRSRPRRSRRARARAGGPGCGRALRERAAREGWGDRRDPRLHRCRVSRRRPRPLPPPPASALGLVSRAPRGSVVAGCPPQRCIRAHLMFWMAKLASCSRPPLSNAPGACRAALLAGGHACLPRPPPLCAFGSTVPPPPAHNHEKRAPL
ncbi:MAG: hypothetical protein J3K34DRAFT_163477 [Monoraphidium minutum]|nr:MAG: hypothetical protein J3K34DRAFT_163477 [Monoraphidium minutum]